MIFMKRFSSFLFLLITLSLSLNAIVIVDNLDNSPIIAASVFNSKGMLIGFSNENGEFRDAQSSDYPLQVRCIGYNNATVEEGAEEVRLDFCTYELPETSVLSNRDGMRVIFYVREYLTTSLDSGKIVTYAENMADVFIPMRKKVKGFKSRFFMKELNKRSYSKAIGNNGREKYKCNVEDPLHNFFFDMFEIDISVVKETNRLALKETGMDTVRAKDYLIVQRKTPSTFNCGYDELAYKKNHMYSPNLLKFLGMTTDFYEMFSTETFYRNGSHSYRVHDLFQVTASLSATCRGKWIKKAYKTNNAVKIKVRFELYPVEIQYITSEESKELQQNEKNVNPMPFRIPENVPALDDATRLLIEKAEKSKNVKPTA